jgi:hypothetical protein
MEEPVHTIDSLLADRAALMDMLRDEAAQFASAGSDALEFPLSAALPEDFECLGSASDVEELEIMFLRMQEAIILRKQSEEARRIEVLHELGVKYKREVSMHPYCDFLLTLTTDR